MSYRCVSPTYVGRYGRVQSRRTGQDKEGNPFGTCVWSGYDETCSSRQADRLTYRELIMDLPGWTAEDQALLDLRLPAHLEC